jgi:hypothetical protein
LENKRPRAQAIVNEDGVHKKIKLESSSYKIKEACYEDCNETSITTATTGKIKDKEVKILGMKNQNEGMERTKEHNETTKVKIIQKFSARMPEIRVFEATRLWEK